MSTDARSRNRWLVPALCVGFGLVYLGIGLAQRNWGFGIGGLVVMLGYGAVLIFGGRRNETIGLLGGDLSDERRTAIQQRAAAATGYLLTVVLVAAMIVAMAANSRYAGVIAAFCGLAGATWIVSTVWFSRRG